MSDQTYAAILAIFLGSDGVATKTLYEALGMCGPVGVIAVNVFRACKASERAKKYRGGQRGRGSFKSMAYEKKSWSIGNLASALLEHGEALGIVWGWALDSSQEFHRDVLYVDLPTGQVSFHTAPRGIGPDYAGTWDGAKGTAPQRICRFCAQVLTHA